MSCVFALAPACWRFLCPGPSLPFVLFALAPACFLVLLPLLAPAHSHLLAFPLSGPLAGHQVTTEPCVSLGSCTTHSAVPVPTASWCPWLPPCSQCPWLVFLKALLAVPQSGTHSPPAAVWVTMNRTTQKPQTKDILITLRKTFFQRGLSVI